MIDFFFFVGHFESCVRWNRVKIKWFVLAGLYFWKKFLEEIFENEEKLKMISEF
jgi:hypothetical protein